MRLRARRSPTRRSDVALAAPGRHVPAVDGRRPLHRPRRLAAGALALLAAGATPAPLVAQSAASPDTIAPDAFVRLTVHWSRRPVAGRVVAVSDTGVRLHPSGASTSVLVPYAEIAAAERRISRGSAGDGARRGARRGLLLGLGATAAAVVVGFASGSSDAAYFIDPRASLAVYGLAFTGVSTALGAAIGSANPPERWTPVAAPRPTGGANAAAAALAPV